jgi:oligo-1,6-glucosidase/alpha-glucosidase
LAYCRVSDGEKYMVVLNMSGYRVKIPVSNQVNNEVLLSTHPQSEAHHLLAFEGRVIRIS